MHTATGVDERFTPLKLNYWLEGMLATGRE